MKRQKLGPRQQAWVDDLFSGKFEQCKNKLTIVDIHGESSHCCLGVACQTALKRGKKLDVNISYDKVYYDNQNGALPSSMIDYLKMRNSCGDVLNEDLKDIIKDRNRRRRFRNRTGMTEDGISLASLNDHDNWNFKQIGNLIKDYPEVFFEKEV